ncbi:MAG: 2-oxo acid dehydrogenase subunit E2, partial [Actinomycetota bacterium]
MTTDPRRDSDDPDGTADAGPNSWLVDEMYRQYLGNPRSVPEEWQEVFRSGVQPNGVSAAATTPPVEAPGAATAAPSPPPPAPATPAAAAPPTPAAAAPSAAPTPATPAAPTNGGPGAATAKPAAATPAPATPPQPAAPAPAPAAAPGNGAGSPPASGNGGGATATPPAATKAAAAPTDDGPVAEPLRGVPARIAANMEASLEVPTATSFREIPAKLLEVNRRVLNNHLKRVRAGKVSFTHLIGYAVVRAIAEEVPNLNNTYETDEDGKPVLYRNSSINVGIAVDQQKADGSRSLIVPVIKGAEAMDFSGWIQ